jgi:Eco57I restriction-modification methylase/restriction endonuclease TaqI-like protein
MVAELSHESSAAYVEGLALDERRRSGTVYTPAALTSFILDQAGITGENVGADAPVLDPACGGGVFLCEILRRAALRLGTTPLQDTARRALLAFAKRNLYGVDVDPHARALTLAALRTSVQHFAPGPLPRTFLDANIIVDDFLLGDAVGKLPPAKRGGFAFIVGNPPYVSTTRLEGHHKPRFRTMFATAFGRVDLYTLFFERSLQLLRSDGVLAFITPDKFLASETSTALREYLVRHGSVRSIARFHSHKVFPGAAVVPCITVVEKSPRDGDLDVLSCQAGVGTPIEVISTSRVRRDELTSAPWQFRSPDLLALVERIRAGCPTLAALSRRISAGPATGRDEIFVRPRQELDDIEPELLRAVVRGRDIAAFSLADPGLQMIVPFDFSTSDPHLIKLASYPRARRYLERHREDLERRHCVRVWEKSWFDLHDSPTIDLARAPKIVVPDIAEHCRFAVDRGCFLPLHSAYYALLQDDRALDYITAVLNSRTIEFLIRLLAPVAKDGFSRFRRQFLAAIPIPLPDARARREIVRAATLTDMSDLDEMVGKLFRLDRKDTVRIKSYLDARARGASE